MRGAYTWDWPPPHNQSRSGQATLEAALGVCAAGANLVGTSALPGLVSRGMILSRLHSVPQAHGLQQVPTAR